MKTIVIVTPANIEVEYRLAGAGSRLAAFTIDLLLQTVVCLLAAAIILMGLPSLDALAGLQGPALAVFILIVFTVYFGYFVVCELTMNGQSVGKKILGLRVIRDNGQPVALAQSVARNVFRIAVDMLYVGIFVILLSKKHKRIGDMAAGTVVVSEHYEPKTGTLLTPVSSPRLNGSFNIRYPHITLTPDEQDILREWLRRKDTLPDGGEALRGQWAAYLAQKWKMDARLLNSAVLERIAALSPAATRMQ